MCACVHVCVRVCVCEFFGCAGVEKYDLLRCVCGLIVGNNYM